MTTIIEEKLPPVHPGEVLLEDCMQPLGLTTEQLAQDLRVPADDLNQIIVGLKSVTPDIALRLARYFGTSAELWLRLQAQYDLEIATNQVGEQINREVKVLAR